MSPKWSFTERSIRTVAGRHGFSLGKIAGGGYVLRSYLFSMLGYFVLLLEAAAAPLGHSHNDYQQSRPLMEALDAHMGSIEVDVFGTEDGEILVGHSRRQAEEDHRTLNRLYWEPLRAWQGEPVDLVVDCKSGPDAVLAWLETQARPAGVARVVLTGLRPGGTPSREWIYLEGTVGELLDNKLPGRCRDISGRWKDYFGWDGQGEMSQDQAKALLKLVEASHAKGLQLRLWSAPDTLDCWQALYQAGVDRINTDNPAQLGNWLSQKERP